MHARPTHLLLGAAIMNLSSSSSMGSQVWRKGDEDWHKKKCTPDVIAQNPPRPKARSSKG